MPASSWATTGGPLPTGAGGGLLGSFGVALIASLWAYKGWESATYSSGEVNSQVQVDIAREAAKAEGLTVVEKTVTNTGEVAQATTRADRVLA